MKPVRGEVDHVLRFAGILGFSSGVQFVNVSNRGFRR